MTQAPTRPRVVCAMSGGVDSSVAAALLQQQGYEVIGVTMQIWPNQAEDERACCSLSAVNDARRVAASLGMRHYVMNMQDEFRAAVIEDFIDNYRAARTPNPCICCNRVLKFGLLLERARALGAAYLATGHYAQVVHHAEVDRWSVRRGVSRTKDQSYALYSLTQEQLAHTLLPLGGLEKDRTREIARELGLRVAAKPDSQEICFVPDNDYGAFLRAEAPEIIRPGAIIDTQGKKLGTHDGVAFYTIGQRRGLGLGGGQTRFVIGLDAATNTVIVGDGAALLRQDVRAADLIYGKYPEDYWRTPRRVTAMLRYKMPAQPATAVLDGDQLQVTFDAPQRAITPGQALVCYDGDDVAVGGTIVPGDSGKSY